MDIQNASNDCLGEEHMGGVYWEDRDICVEPVIVSFYLLHPMPTIQCREASPIDRSQNMVVLPDKCVLLNLRNVAVAGCGGAGEVEGKGYPRRSDKTRGSSLTSLGQ